MKNEDGTEPEAYLFDMDGTLVDSIPGIGWALGEAFRSIGRTMPVSDLRAAIGPPIRVIAKRLDPSLTDAETVEIERVYRPLYDMDGWCETAMFDGVAETLGALHKARRRLFLVTNKPRIPTLKILDQLGLATLFEGVSTRDSKTPHYGSKAEMVGEMIAAHGLSAARSALVGDTVEDHEAADAHGLPFVFASYGYGHDPAAHYVIHRFADLISTEIRHGQDFQTT